MTYNEIINIARRLDKETQKEIDQAVEERLEILKEGDLSQEDMEKMEECLYITLVLQEYLSGEHDLLEEEKALLLEEMEEMFNEYGELLTKAKLEEKLTKKKRMALELMKIREELMKRKERVKDVDKRMKENQENQEAFKELSGKDKMQEIAEDNKKDKGNNKSDLKNPDKMRKFGTDNDMHAKKQDNIETLKKKHNQEMENQKKETEYFREKAEKIPVEKQKTDVNAKRDYANDALNLGREDFNPMPRKSNERPLKDRVPEEVRDMTENLNSSSMYNNQFAQRTFDNYTPDKR